MSTHTPDKWRTGKWNFDNIVEPANQKLNGGYIIASTYGPDSSANVLLIAAAPTMLAALRAVVDWYEEHENDGQVIPGHIQAAYAAIRAVKGK